MNLRPRALTELLARCRSVKDDAYSFVYADKHAHAWRKHMTPRNSRWDMVTGRWY
ncbi:type IV toxin-antitoxin system AbiEi family antitoxin domain-containing protein [Mesorhizobium sp.]|uniref:type IV toxin-antitoxin system AbiEi family antitoxin domain-containing protein n=1 Tax=Mesorhizobium sp. TaxID=1871066 RepID=UPI00345D47D9